MTGPALRRKRKARVLSTAAAAKAFGVSRRSWVRWEKEGVPRSRAIAIKLAWKDGGQ